MTFVQSPVLIVVVLLISAFFINGAGWFNKRWCYPLTLISLLISGAASIITLLRVIRAGTIRYHLGGWPAPIGIEYVVDHLNGLVLVVVSVVSVLAVLFSKRSVEHELPDKVPQFYTLYVLFVTGLQGMVITGDAFNLYVLLEIASITGYALIAVGKDRALLSSIRYVIMGTIGACFYLLGVGHLYITTGSLNMADIMGIIPAIAHTNAILVGFILIMVGVWIKMALFPLHGWLPNAYTYSPTATAVLVAPLMTKVSVYIMIRMMFSVFSANYAYSVLNSNVIVWMATMAIIGGAMLALTQTDLRKMLGFLIVSEVGYMVGGVWLANANGITGAILHIVNDAMMTLCLFLVAGIIGYMKGGVQFSDLQGMYRKMPLTMAAFTVGALSMIGVPPLAGFFSKWYLLLGSVEAGHWGFAAALVFSSLINAVLFFRIIEIAFFEPLSGHHGDVHHVTVEEAPASMLLPLLVTAVLLIVVGLYTREIVSGVIQYAIPELGAL